MSQSPLSPLLKLSCEVILRLRLLESLLLWIWHLPHSTFHCILLLQRPEFQLPIYPNKEFIEGCEFCIISNIYFEAGIQPSILCKPGQIISCVFEVFQIILLIILLIVKESFHQIITVNTVNEVFQIICFNEGFQIIWVNESFQIICVNEGS